jgi:hypothetical protein
MKQINVERRWVAHVWIASACILLLLAATYVAPLAGVLAWVEGWIAPALLTCASVLWWRQRKGLPHRLECRGRWGLWLTLTLSLFPLIAAWSGQQQHGITSYAAIGGWMPWSDAGKYYSGAVLFLDTGQLDPWACRRPFNALLLAIRLALSGGDLQGALILQSLLGGLALWLAAREIGRLFGQAASLFFLGLCYAFFRVFAPTTLSECLGLTLGLLAIPALLRAVYGQHRRLAWLLGACAVLSMGQMVRPGTVLLLPAIIAWATFSLARRNIKQGLIIAILLVSACAIPVLGNKLSLRLYSADDGIANANFVYTFYGFTQGLNWKEAETELLGRSHEIHEGETWHEAAYRFSFEALREKPTVFVLSLCGNGLHAAITLPQHLMDLLFRTSIRTSASKGTLLLFAGLTLVLFAPVGITTWSHLRARSFPHGWFWALCVTGIVATIPIIIRDGGIRVFAATFPLICTLGAALFAPPKQTLKLDRRKSVRSSGACIGIAIALLLTALILPGIIASRRSPTEQSRVQLDAKYRIVIHVLPDGHATGSSIAARHRDRRILMNEQDFRRATRYQEMSEAVLNLKPPFSLVMGLEQGLRVPIYGFIEGLPAISAKDSIQLERGEQALNWVRLLSVSPRPGQSP